MKKLVTVASNNVLAILDCYIVYIRLKFGPRLSTGLLSSHGKAMAESGNFQKL